MTDIWCPAIAVYPRCMTFNDSYVVEHGSISKKQPVKLQFRMAVCHTESLLCHSLAMCKEKLLKLCLFLTVESVYDFLPVHC